MFFFFVGGVNQQVRQVIKRNAGTCISCGSPASLVEYENVLKLFFVPVWRWPGKTPVMYCENCKLFMPESFSLPPPDKRDSGEPSLVANVLRCHSCARVVDPDFRFCPFCGNSL